MKARRNPTGRVGGVGTVAAADRKAAPARGRRAGQVPARGRTRRPVESPARPARTRPQEPRGQRQGPQSAPAARPAERAARPKSAGQARARAKARKAKAPKIVRPPLRERLSARLARVDLSPRSLLAKVPFVVLVIVALAVGLGVTLWLSTDAAQRSYQLGNARAVNAALSQQKAALERDVLEAQSAPALAEAARNLGMIPSRETAHLVKDPAGNWVVVGQPKPAEGAPPPPLNFKLPEEVPAAPPRPGAPAPKPGAEVEIPVLRPPPHPAVVHGAAPATVPGMPPLPGPPPSAPAAPVPPAPAVPGAPDPAAGVAGGLVTPGAPH